MIEIHLVHVPVKEYTGTGAHMYTCVLSFGTEGKADSLYM